MIWSVLRRPFPPDDFGSPTSYRDSAPFQAHSDVFGGDFDGDGIDDVGMDYESKYDDFM